jgi:hypothetical protein
MHRRENEFCFSLFVHLLFIQFAIFLNKKIAFSIFFSILSSSSRPLWISPRHHGWSTLDTIWGEVSLCRSRGLGALIVSIYSFRILAAKNNRPPAAAKNAVKSGNANPTKSGDHTIRIIFGVFTSSKRKTMEPGLSIKSGIADKTPIMFAVMLHSCKSTGSAIGKRYSNM